MKRQAAMRAAGADRNCSAALVVYLMVAMYSTTLGLGLGWLIWA